MEINICAFTDLNIEMHALPHNLKMESSMLQHKKKKNCCLLTNSFKIIVQYNIGEINHTEVIVFSKGSGIMFVYSYQNASVCIVT
jgi:hypothetical protein